MSSAKQHHSKPEDAVHRTMDVFIAAVPTGIPTVLVFSLGTRIRMLKHKKIDVLQVDKIKTAAATEVVCFDKTGTLTSTVVSLTSACTVDLMIFLVRGCLQQGIKWHRDLERWRSAA